jgi:tetratricopeptide (TPR) repeat protein
VAVANRPWCAALIACLVLVSSPACRRSADSGTPSSSTPTGRVGLREVSLPDLSVADESVQTQTKERFATLQQKLGDRSVPDADLALAFGELGVLLHAAEYYEAAKPAYLNARQLDPSDARWPYYLGHLARSEGDTPGSIAAFQRVLELSPNDVPAMVWLGRGYLEMSQPEPAAQTFEQAIAAAPQNVAALAGLGQAALARKDYRRATQVLEQALSIHPGVASLHSPLAMAYRGLGDTAKADAHLKQWRNTDITFEDPLREQIDMALQSGLSYELRGVRALEAQDFKAAADLFRRGLELAPPNSGLSRSIQHKLGTALALEGNVEAAVRHFEEVVRTAPPDQQDEPAAKAHYSLGVLGAGAGNVDLAARHLTSALRYNPNYLEARLALGDLQRRHGRFAESMKHYQEALRINSRVIAARLGYAMALVRLGRYREARDWLDESVRAQPDTPEAAHALARILASAPDASVRDGRRAMAIVQQIAATNNTTEVGETMAMAAAELGDFTQAVTIQGQVLHAAQSAGQYQDVNRITANLRLYQKGQPVRVPWPADHPVHQPGS